MNEPTCITLEYTLTQNVESGIGNAKMSAVRAAIERAYTKALNEHGLDGATSTTLRSKPPKRFDLWFWKQWKRQPAIVAEVQRTEPKEPQP